eukprot:Hpha_TRINITY_DN12463_c0_g3::TRINITY_DN12463_c0_g3_i1::g.42721::m.42721
MEGGWSGVALNVEERYEPAVRRSLEKEEDLERKLVSVVDGAVFMSPSNGRLPLLSPPRDRIGVLDLEKVGCEGGQPSESDSDDDGLAQWAFGGGGNKGMKRRKSAPAPSGAHPRFGLLGWDERLRNFGKKGKLPKATVFQPSEYPATADVPGISLTCPSFSGIPTSDVPLACPERSSSSSDSLDELLMSIQAGIARKGRQKARRRRKRKASVPSSSTSSSSDSSDSSAGSSSSEADAEPLDAEQEIKPSSPTSPWTPVKVDGETSSPSPAGPSPFVTARRTSLPSPPLGSPAFQTGRRGSGPSLPQGSPTKEGARRGSIPDVPPSNLSDPLAGSGIANSLGVTPPLGPQESSHTLGIGDLSLAGEESPSLEPRRVDSIQVGTHVAHRDRGNGIITSVFAPRTGALNGAMQITYESGEVHAYRQSALASSTGRLKVIGLPSEQFGSFAGTLTSFAGTLCNSFANMSFFSLNSPSMSPSNDDDLATEDGGRRRKFRRVRALHKLRPSSHMLGLLRRAVVAPERRESFQVLRKRTLQDFTVGMSVVHETKGEGKVVRVDMDKEREVTVDFGADSVAGVFTFPEARLFGGRLQPISSLPRSITDFEKEMLVSHERHGWGRVVEVDSSNACVMVEFSGARERYYGELSLARGRLQPCAGFDDLPRVNAATSADVDTLEGSQASPRAGQLRPPTPPTDA